MPGISPRPTLKQSFSVACFSRALRKGPFSQPIGWVEVCAISALCAIRVPTEYKVWIHGMAEQARLT
jgi:hypothetical protein